MKSEHSSDFNCNGVDKIVVNKSNIDLILIRIVN